MLITCPQCLTNYDVPPVLEETGQKVKCVKCGCVWEIDDGTVEPEAEDLPDFDDEAAAFDPAPVPEIGEPDIPMPAFQDFFKPPEKKNRIFLNGSALCISSACSALPLQFICFSSVPPCARR